MPVNGRSLYPRRVILLSAASLLLLASCVTVGPDYQPPPSAVAHTWQVQDVAIASTPATLQAWWQQLADPVLSQLIMQALAANPDLDIAAARLRESRARLGVNNATRLPSLSASAAARRSAASDSRSTEIYTLGFDASWELDLFGGRRRTLEAASADYQVAEASLHDVQVTLVAEVARNYANYRSLEQRLSLARTNLDSQLETLQLVRWREQAGLVSGLDTAQARAEAEQSRAQLPRLASSQRQAALRLAGLLGQAPGTLPVLLAPAPASLVVPASLAVGIPAEVLRQRPDVIAAERRLAAETARIGVAEAALYPSLNLSGSLGLSATSPGRLVSDGTSSDSSNFGINLPLFNGGRLRQALALQSAVQEQALLNYEKTLLAALEDVENALFGMVSNRARIEALTAAADAANAAALLARQRYTSGLVDFAVVLTTERSQRSVEDSLVSARNDEILAVISLYKALGGGWPATTVTPPASDPQVTL